MENALKYSLNQVYANPNFFLRFPPPKAVKARILYTVCTWSQGRRHCNKVGAQAPRRGMLFWPILQHCSKSIALLGDCSRMMTSQ